MVLAEGGVEVLDELSREPHGKLFLSDGHAVLGGGHRRSFRHAPGRFPAGADNQHRSYHRGPQPTWIFHRDGRRVRELQNLSF